MENRPQIDKLMEQCKKCSNINELKELLFEMTQIDMGAKQTTGIGIDIIQRFNIEDIITIAQNFQNSQDKFDLLKTMKLSDLDFNHAQQIFNENELLLAIKKFNIRVNANNIQQLYIISDGNDKDFIEELLKLNITDYQSLTEIILQNLSGEKLLEIIRENDLKVSPEQWKDILIQFDGIEISEQNQSFINTMNGLMERNDEVTNTINYKILSEKYKGLTKYLPILTCHPEIQSSIINLDDGTYQTFFKCLDYYSGITQDWTVAADNILKNINSYKELIENLQIQDFSEPERIQVLTKILSEPNYFQINNLDEYIEKKNRICDLIINDPNSDELRQFSLISEMSESDRIRFAVLEKNFGLSLEQAQSLILKFGDDIDTLKGLDSESDYYCSLISSLKYICDEKNIEQITEVLFINKNTQLNPNLIERQIKNTYDRNYVSQLYRPIEEDFEREEDGVQIFKAGKSTNGRFVMETHSPGAVYADETLRTGQFREAWNKPKMQSQAFCTITSSNEMLVATNTPFVEYGFYSFEEDSLRAAGYEDISSDALGFTIFADQDEKYCSVQEKINKTRNINENDRARMTSSGQKMQPDYIRVRKSRHLNGRQETMMSNAMLAAKQFGIPIVLVDQDECTIRENNAIREMLELFNETKDPKLITSILNRFENNRMGNTWNKIDFSIDQNPRADEIGKSIITRNEMLTAILDTIMQCPDRTQSQTLYRSLTRAVEVEAKKFKKPGYKMLNDKGIPIVPKEQMRIEEYFGMKLDKETGEPIEETAISAYRKYITVGLELEKKIQRRTSEEITMCSQGIGLRKQEINGVTQETREIITQEAVKSSDQVSK